MREDVQIALDRFQIKTFGNKKSLAKAESLLSSDETVLYAGTSNVTITHANTRKKEKLPGVVLLTTGRFLFVCVTPASMTVESISLNEVQSVDCGGNSMTGHTIGIHTLTKSFSILVTYKREIAQKILDCFEEAKNSVAIPAPAETSSSSISAADEILRYKGLLDCGAITEADYEAKKKQLLGI